MGILSNVASDLTYFREICCIGIELRIFQIFSTFSISVGQTAFRANGVSGKWLSSKWNSGICPDSLILVSRGGKAFRCVFVKGSFEPKVSLDQKFIQA